MPAGGVALRRRRLGRVALAHATYTPAAMSQESVEIVRKFMMVGVDEALTCADPDILWNPIEELPTQGHSAVRASVARWKAEWDDYEMTPEEFVDKGDSVVVTVSLGGRGRGSGIPIDARFYDVYTLRDGKIVGMDQFAKHAEALGAAGATE